MKTLVTTFVIGLLVSAMILNSKTVSASDIAANEIKRDLVVIEPPANFKSAVVKLGYTVGQEFDMEALSMRALKVTFPTHLTLDSALTELELHFPGIIVDDSEV